MTVLEAPQPPNASPSPESQPTTTSTGIPILASKNAESPTSPIAAPPAKQTELERRLQKSLLSAYMYTSIPPLLSNLAGSLLTFTDGIVISNILGPDGLASVTYAQTVDYAIRAAVQIICTGSVSVLSAMIGSNQSAESRNLIPSTIIYMNILFSLIMMAVLIPSADPIFRAMGARGITLQYTSEYAQVLIYGSPIFFFNMSFSALLQAEGLSLWAMVCSVVSTLFNPLVSFLLLKYTSIGIRGAAIGTLVSLAVSGVIAISLFFTRVTVCKIRPLLAFQSFRESLRICGKMVVIGLGDAFGYFAFTVVYSFYNYFVSKIVAEKDLSNALSAVGALGRLYGIVTAVFLAFGSLGFLPIAGYFVGQRNKAMLKRILHLSLLFMTVLLVLCSVLVMSLHRYIGMIFSKEENYLYFFKVCILVSFPTLALGGAQFVLISYAQALGDAVRLIIVSVLCLMLYQPIILVVMFYATKSYAGLLVSFSGNDVLSIVTCVAIFWEPIRRPEIFIDKYIQSISKNPDAKGDAPSAVEPTQKEVEVVSASGGGPECAAQSTA